jgi:hypothetical protein
MSTLRRCLLLCAVFVSGCIPTIIVEGPSGPYGTAGTPGTGGYKEPGGGWIDKVKAAIGTGPGAQAHVLNRAIPGFTIPYWIARENEMPGGLCPKTGPEPYAPRVCLESIYWPPRGYRLLPEPAPLEPYWTDVPTPAPTPYAGSYAETAILAGGTPATSAQRVCDFMMMSNDLFLHGAETFCEGTLQKCGTGLPLCPGGLACVDKSPIEYAHVAFARYQALIASVADSCSTILVNTELCGPDPGDGGCLLNTRCRTDGKCDGPYIREANNLIRATYGANVIDVDAGVTALGAADYAPFPDTIHPVCAVHTMAAEVVLDGLVARGIVATTGTPIPPCS